VRIVAIGALDQALFDAMVEWFLEIGPLLDVAGEAQRSLILEKLVFQLRVMYGVAGCAGNAVFVVSRPQEFMLLGIRLVTRQAAPANVVRPGAFELEYLCFVTATFNVRRARAMA